MVVMPVDRATTRGLGMEPLHEASIAGTLAGRTNRDRPAQLAASRTLGSGVNAHGVVQIVVATSSGHERDHGVVDDDRVFGPS